MDPAAAEVGEDNQMKFKSCIRTECGKCDVPENTIRRIEDGFHRMNLDLHYYSCTSAEHLISGHLRIPVLNFASNGKGITPMLAKASTYAEMAERFSAGLHFKLTYKRESATDELIDRFSNFTYLSGYTYAHQDDVRSPVKIEDLLAGKHELSVSDIASIKNSDIAKHWVDYYSVLDDRTRQVPLKFVKRISGSNGLAAGNTIEEAIVHASNEIFERYALRSIIGRGKKELPTIRVESIESDIVHELIDFFRSNDIDIIVKDFSDGILPCLGVLFINRNLENDGNRLKRFGYRMVNLASSFSTEEALLRCFTERLQGREGFEDFKYWKHYDDLWEKWFERKKIRGCAPAAAGGLLFKKGFYEGDLSFLEKGVEKELENVKVSDCLDEIGRIAELCRRLDTDFLVIDQTHPVLDFPVVRVIMPRISDVPTFFPGDGNARELTTFDHIQRDTLGMNVYGRYIDSDDWLDDDGRIRELIREIEDNISACPHNLVLVTRGLNNRALHLFELLASLYHAIGDDESRDICRDLLVDIFPERKDRYLSDGIEAWPGHYRFLIANPLKNPFIAWCDDPCERECQKKYEKSLREIMKTFFRDDRGYRA